jgi:glycosyltransferase involved in cell wall biosynthesis
MSVLYISYDGVLEPLGQSQVLAYIKCLAKSRTIYLISFEKADEWADVATRENLRREIYAAGIVWYPLKYHKWPSLIATSWDIACGAMLCIWLVYRYRISILHARSYVPSVIALAIKRITGVRFIFDMRGFWADEKVDGGSWKHDSNIYLVTKWFESKFLKEADHVISLTHAAEKIMKQFSYLQNRMPPVTVIPTCADLLRFKPMPHLRIGVGLVIGYVGTSGNWYLFDETAACFAELLRIHPETKFLIVNKGEHEYISERLAAAGVPSESVKLTTATYAEMPSLISHMDASIFFIKPVFSKQASAATKLAELLGCGVPCLSNSGVGDMADVLEHENVGVAIKDFNRETVLAGLEQLLALIADKSTPTRCIEVAHNYYSLVKGVASYDNIYKKLGA